MEKKRNAGSLKEKDSTSSKFSPDAEKHGDQDPEGRSGTGLAPQTLRGVRG